MNLFQQFAFPVDSLPPLFHNAIKEACEITGVPIPLAAGLAFTSAAVACQGHIRVRSPAGIVSPLSLFAVHVAKSGERKSTVERLFVRGIRDFQTFHEKRAADGTVKHTADQESWSIERNVLQRKLEEAQDCSDEDFECQKERLLAHDLARPQEVLIPKVFFADTTPEALLQKLATRWPSAVLQSSEASLILAGRATKSLSSLNVLWDGGEVDVDRRNGDSFTVRDAQLSASLMVQPGVIQKFISKGNGQARDIGFLARCLICAPTSTQGMRLIHSLEPKACDHLDKFAQVTRQVLRDHLSDEGVLCSEKTVLEFSHDAAREWVAFYNRVESSLAPGGCYSDIPDFASKIGENVARMAAIFHTMEGKTGKLIDGITTQSAVVICTWYLDEFKRLLGEPQQLSEEYSNARILEQWFQEKCVQYKSYYVPKSYLRNYGPNRLREKKALEGALSQLVTENRLTIGLQKNKQIIFLNQQFFRSHQRHFFEPDRNPVPSINSYI